MLMLKPPMAFVLAGPLWTLHSQKNQVFEWNKTNIIIYCLLNHTFRITSSARVQLDLDMDFLHDLDVDIVKVDALLVWKNPKRQFFRDIGKSFHEVTQIGLEPHQIFSFWNISTNTVARGVQSFGRNGP